MNTLIIDCSAGMSVYVLKNDEIFSRVDFDQKKHTDNLLVVVDELLNQANLKIDEIENLCVCIGPGSFTGIRVAISIIKGLAVSSNSKVFVLSNFDILETSKTENSVYVLEGFSKFVYARTIINGEKFDECVDINELKERLKNNNFEIYVQNEKLQNLFKNDEIQAQIAQNSIILHFLNKIKKNEYIEINQIEPIYLRASQAEIERNKKLEGRS